MGNIYGAEESRLNLTKGNKRKLVSTRFFYVNIQAKKSDVDMKRILQPGGC